MSCYHWGLSPESDCRKLTNELVYRDKNGHQYCLLHAPKYYVQPKGFFLGHIEGHNANSIQFKKEDFDKLLEKTISNQKEHSMIRFDKVYFPDNFHYTLPLDLAKGKDIWLIECSFNLTICNSQVKRVSITRCKIDGLTMHNLEIDETLIHFSKISKYLTFRNNSYNTFSIQDCEVNCRVDFRDNSVKDNSQFKCSVYFNQSIFNRTVKIENLHYDNDLSEVRILDNEFNNNLYYLNNKIGDEINFIDNKFNNSFAYLENIDLSKTKFDLRNLEYLRFNNCRFPKKLKSIEDESLQNAYEIYQALKRNSFEQNDNQAASKWHYLEKHTLKKIYSKSKKIFNLIILTIYNLLSGYGEKPGKALFVLVVEIIMILAIYIYIGNRISENLNSDIIIRCIFSLSDGIPFINFPIEYTLKQLLVRNTDLIKISHVYNVVAGIGKILISLQLALFSFAIRNKMKRN